MFSRAKDIKVAFEVITHCLKIQIDLVDPEGGKEVREKLISDQSLGYIFGFTDGILQVLRITKDKDRLKLLKAVYTFIFSEEQADDLFQKTMTLQTEKNFNYSRKIGGKQAIDFLKTKKPQMGLCHLLFDHPLEIIYSEQ